MIGWQMEGWQSARSAEGSWIGADVVRDVLFDEQNLWSFGRLTDTPDLPQLAGEDIPAGERYVSVTLHAQRVAHGRKVTTTYYPAVRCFATVKRLLAEPAQFSTITTPTELEAISETGSRANHLRRAATPRSARVLGTDAALDRAPRNPGGRPGGAVPRTPDRRQLQGGHGCARRGRTHRRIAETRIYAVTGAGRETMEVGYAVGALEARTDTSR